MQVGGVVIYRLHALRLPSARTRVSATRVWCGDVCRAEGRHVSLLTRVTCGGPEVVLCATGFLYIRAREDAPTGPDRATSHVASR